MLQAITVRWTRLAHRGWIVVLALALASGVAAAFYVRDNLGLHTDTADMLSAELEWRRLSIDFDRQFPHFSDNLLIVVDGESPDLAAVAAGLLTQALGRLRDVFERVEQPDDLAFLRRNALLFMDADERDRLVTELARAQPLLGRLSRDPGLATVLELMSDALEHERGLAPAELDRFASRLAQAIDATLAGRFHRLSWQRQLAGDDAGSRQRIILAAPVLDYQQLFPAARALEEVRAAARDLGLTPERGVRVRVTGGLALSDEELRSVSVGAGRAAVLALVGVAVVLLVGLGSARLVLVTLLTLVAGLLWTAAFAAFAVGHLNMISVAFAVLYIGLGVDYAVHYGLRYREQLREGLAHDQALERAAGDVGSAIALCALTTGVGFFAFLPTSFAGVSELGLIAGVGMFVSLAATLTLMPALLTAVRPRRRELVGRLGTSLPLGRSLDLVGRRHPHGVSLAAAAVALASALLVSGARFDENPLNLRDPRGEAVSTYRERIADGDNWSLDALVASRDEARSLAARLSALPAVRRVVWLEDFVPEDQEGALAAVEELALLLGPDLDVVPAGTSESSRAEPRLARLAAALEAREGTRGLASLESAVARLQARIGETDPDTRAALLERLEDAVVGLLPDALARLSDLLHAAPVRLAELPPELVRDWRAPDGRLRLRIDAVHDLNGSQSAAVFVEQVRRVAPQAVGTPIVHLESARAVVAAFVEAFALALLCIAVILYVSLRRVRDVVVVLAPLLLAAVVTGATMVVLGMPFNFANVIALPLLLGVGVDSGIHMLSRARNGHAHAPLAASSTARGVITSALTTTVSFGNLALSAHPGTASMGTLLTIGMLATLVATLLLLPALVTLLAERAVPEAVP